jgi:hypothetical protein
MNEETAKKNIGSFFTIKGRKCEVTKVDHFSGVLHFGFVTADNWNDKPFICGWIPVEFVGQCEW